MVSSMNEKLNDIPGVCGIVTNSVMEGFYGIEAVSYTHLTLPTSDLV